MDKWYGVQAMAVRSDLRSRLVSLAQREDFDRRNPNRVRALAASFAMSNPVAFHKPDGWGYRFLGDMILEIDPLNPALSARLASAFESWRSFDAPRRSAAQTELERLAGRPLSKNALDILGRALAEGPDPAG
jgi:aminopeptidase N